MDDHLDIKRRIETVFGHVHAERMQDVPILNPRLKVEAVGLREWNGAWLAAVITPWFLNLMLFSDDEATQDRWRLRAAGDKIVHRFPAGRFEFILGEENGLGRYQMCSLFSPVLEFDNHETAVLTAEAALDALFDSGATEPETDTTADTKPPIAAHNAPRDINRRDFFAGRVTAGQGADEH